MKKPLDPRHLKRQYFLEELFKLDFLKQKTGLKTRNIFNKKNEIDELIKKAAPQFPIEKINKVDLAILRLAFYELFFEKKEPEKVIINEAIELAKEYGNDTSPAFINGSLDSAIKYEFT